MLPSTHPVHSTILWLLIVSLSLFSFVRAQSSDYDPIDAFGTNSIYIEGQGLYISGGTMSTETAVVTDQYFNIDLSVSWTTSKPAFMSGGTGPDKTNGASALTADGMTWLLYSSGTVFGYSFMTKTWSSVSTAAVGGVVGNITGVADPESDLVYFPNLFQGAMMIWNSTSKDFTRGTMPTALVPTKEFSVAWSAPQHKMLFVGGTSTAAGQIPARLTVYSYSSKGGWVDVTTTMKGDLPPGRGGACFLPFSGGSKMVLFGGFTSTRAVYSDIYVLDVASMTWTKGPNAATGRAQTACGISNNQLIAWSGRDAKDAINSTVVYNLQSSKWTPSYTPPSTSTSTVPGGTMAPGPATTSGTSSSSGGSSQLITIVATSLAVMAVILASGIFLLLRRRNTQKDNQGPSPRTPEPSELDTFHHDDSLPDTPLTRPVVHPNVAVQDAPKEVPRRGPQLYTPALYAHQGPHTIPLNPPDSSAKSHWYPNPQNSVQGPQDHEAFTALHHSPVSSATLSYQGSPGAPQQGSYGAERRSQHPHEMVNFMDVYSLPTSDLDVDAYDNRDMLPMNQIHYPKSPY